MSSFSFIFMMVQFVIINLTIRSRSRSHWEYITSMTDLTTIEMEESPTRDKDTRTGAHPNFCIYLYPTGMPIQLYSYGENEYSTNPQNVPQHAPLTALCRVNHS
mmetsp:Transcript_9484/g.13429  ORF Transcript_9484/g.13429 Transcript_9484/m.13429 type:complete len:104 (+) Transcript_9484:1240-1551(+)